MTMMIRPMSDKDRCRNEEVAANELKAMEATFKEGDFLIME